MASKSKKQKASRPYELPITAWFEYLDVNDTQVAEKIGVARETIWRWRKEQWRLDPLKIRRLAQALGIKPEQLWHPPSRQSIDAMLDGADEETHKMAADIVRRMLRK